MKNIAIVLAAGNGKRCGLDKLFLASAGVKNILERTLEVFEKSEKIDEILLVVPLEKINLENKGEQKYFAVLQEGFSKIKNIISGGGERFFSLEKAVDFLILDEKSKSKKAFLNNDSLENIRIIVHNGANPNLEISDLELGIEKAVKYKNIVFGHFCSNSIKKISGNKIVENCNRENYFEAQTPQITNLRTLKKGLLFIKKNPQKVLPTDESSILELIGESVYFHETTQKNKKITFLEDYEIFFEAKSNFRIGLGEDSHRFLESFDPQNPITLGGVAFLESEKTFEANSDGDVVLHAICNALLSSVGERTFDGIAGPLCRSGIKNSEVYLKKTLEKIYEKNVNFSIENCVISIEARFPKIAPKHEMIVKKLSKILKINLDQIGLTYTTGENLSDFGRGLGVRVLVEVLVKI